MAQTISLSIEGKGSQKGACAFVIFSGACQTTMVWVGGGKRWGDVLAARKLILSGVGERRGWGPVRFFIDEKNWKVYAI